MNQQRSPIESAVERYATGTPFQPQQSPSFVTSLDDDIEMIDSVYTRGPVASQERIGEETKADHSYTYNTTNTSNAEKESGLLKKIVKNVDYYGIKPRPKSVAGGIVTLLFFAAAGAVAVVMLLQLVNAPPQYDNDITWSNMHAPFPLTLRCESASGCLLSSTIQDGTFSSCTTMAADEEIVVDFYSFASPLDGVSVLAQDRGNYSAIASVKSELYMPSSSMADSDGTMIKYHGVIPGTVYLTHVFTQNYTLGGSGRARREYYQLQTDFSAGAMTRTTSCALDGDGMWSGSSTAQARIRLQPQTTFVTVTSPFDPFSWLGQSSGMAAGLLGAGKGAVSIAELLGFV